MSCEEFECTAREVQNLFNHLDLVDRAAIHNYTVTWLSWKAASAALTEQLGQPAIKTTLRFRSREKLVSFGVHAFLSLQLDILASGLLDPKSISFLGKIYFSTPGGPIS
jgi:hypothetical protein